MLEIRDWLRVVSKNPFDVGINIFLWSGLVKTRVESEGELHVP